MAEIWYRSTEGRNIPHAVTRIEMTYSCDLTVISGRERKIILDVP